MPVGQVAGHLRLAQHNKWNREIIGSGIHSEKAAIFLVSQAVPGLPISTI